MDVASFDLNTATAVELCEECPRLGLLLAEDIVAWRSQHGPFTDEASIAALAGELAIDEAVVAELVAGLRAGESERTPRTKLPGRTTLIDGAPPEAAPAKAPLHVEDVVDAEAQGASPKPAGYMDPWAPTEGAAEVESEDVSTSASSLYAADPSEETRASQPEERVEGFRARLAAARALALAANAAKAEAEAARSSVPEAEEMSAPVAESAPVMEAAEAVDAAGEAVTVVDAVSQTVVDAPAPPPTAAPVEAPPARPARRRLGMQTIVIAAVVLVNAGLGFGLASLHRDEQQNRAPVAAISADVKEMQSAQTATAAELDHTRARLDEHEATLAKTMEKVNAVAQHQADAEREAKERADRETKELAAMNARVNRMERKVDVEVRSVDDALKAIDIAQKRSATPEAIARH